MAISPTMETLITPLFEVVELVVLFAALFSIADILLLILFDLVALKISYSLSF